eukprot:TRINITY_DN12837_c0_g1_i2.p1 TRINITY_DN12837_c0_g1~~TRINITY_DN12837_c0_g1_i2.p1  ORF type:complete len:299 (-),score=42.26 TRINITY_DN12837_c0_g1_i2:105-1001(-)
MLYFCLYLLFFFFQAEDGIRDAQESRGLGDVYKRQDMQCPLSLALLDDRVWAGRADGDIVVFDQAASAKKQLTAHSGAVFCLLPIRNQTMYSGGADWKIREWDMELTLLREFTGHANSVRCLGWSGNLLFSSGDDHQLCGWDVANQVSTDGATVTLDAYGSPATSMATSPTHIWTGTQDGTLCCWQTSGEKVSPSYEAKVHTKSINAVLLVGVTSSFTSSAAVRVVRCTSGRRQATRASRSQMRTLEWSSSRSNDTADSSGAWDWWASWSGLQGLTKTWRFGAAICRRITTSCEQKRH